MVCTALMPTVRARWSGHSPSAASGLPRGRAPEIEAVPDPAHDIVKREHLAGAIAENSAGVYGGIWYYRGTSWTAVQTIDSPIISVSCVGVDQCALDWAGNVLNETQVVAAPGEFVWTAPQTVNSNQGQYLDPSISCVNADYCVAVEGVDNEVYTWDGDNPWPSTAPGGLYQLGPADEVYGSGTSPAGETVTAVSCPSMTFCVAVDGTNGEVFVGTN
jgi:hypothetical protein